MTENERRVMGTMQRREKGRGRRDEKGSQIDIKKLRRENEQLRREIWSLRDEYDKLEEILKRQKNQPESDESEDRSEEDDEEELHSDYSDENVHEEEPVGASDDKDRRTRLRDREEQLENAENQKISTEKMNGNNNNLLHRLHVDFDDLSVVDEEEELKKDKDKKFDNVITTNEEGNQRKSNVRLFETIRKLHDNIPFYPGTYESCQGYTEPNYFSDCPLFECPNTIVDQSIPGNNVPTVIPFPCPNLYADPLIPLSNMDSPLLNPMNDNNHLSDIHVVPPIGWQNNMLVSETKQLSSYTNVLSTGISNATMGISDFERTSQMVTTNNTQIIGNNSNLTIDESHFDSTEIQGKQQFSKGLFEDSSLANDVWDDVDLRSIQQNNLKDNERKIIGDCNIENEEKDSDEPYSYGGTTAEKRKHFFAPLATLKSKKLLDEDSPNITGNNYFGTGNSSSSGKTVSTVICGGNNNQLLGNHKGSVDVCVNGAVSYGNNFVQTNKDDIQRTYLSTENLSIIKSIPINNQLIKSMSCQDLTSDNQNMMTKLNNNNDIGQMTIMTKSDNTLDNFNIDNSTTKAYKSHLNVTLKIPRKERDNNVNTPEIPKLPTLDYRILTNPFLRNIERIGFECPERDSPLTKPLTVQVNENNMNYNYPSSPLSSLPLPPPPPPLPPPPLPPSTSFVARGLRPPSERYRRRQDNIVTTDQNRLLIPTDQLISKKNLSPSTQDFQVTSFERPSPHTLLPSAMPYDLETIRRINATRYLQNQNQNLYQNVPFVPSGPTGHVCHNIRMYYDQIKNKVQAQTQTSIDGDSHIEDEQIVRCSRQDDDNVSLPNTPSVIRRKRAIKKEKFVIKQSISPHAQRKLKKQSSVTSTETTPDSPDKSVRCHRPRKLSVTTTTTSDALEDKNESRSSSSGQDSPRKDQIRRVSSYFNPKKRPSVTSIKTTRSASLETTSKEKYSEGLITANSDKEMFNTGNIRDSLVKSRKGSTSSGNVPWCACWGNGCI
ncbi:uncharacterized protein LOC118449833 isoform X2 [Vespa mandarinia]|uniref:uncharacterized protein LOC118449833 isoform X2 n=2 Tax=Vespa mandarinia TaxID=7446 RepID=UPI00161ECC7A|nr:uncharacterized protein LOC118449833 isoform X2 [Vespa mandarinia]